MYNFLYYLTWIFWRIFFPCKVEGKKNWKNKQPMVVVCNHLSNIDPIYINAYVRERKKFLAKKELYKNKFVGGILNYVGAMPIDRGKIDLGAIKASLKTLKDGKKLVIFPEGTRNKDGEDLQEVKNGASMLAIKARVPVLPVHIEKRGRVFRRNKLVIGEAFELSEFYDKRLDTETLNQATAVLEKHLLAVGTEVVSEKELEKQKNVQFEEAVVVENNDENKNSENN